MNPDNLSTGIKSITIKPGETVVLPKGAVVKSMIYDGAISVSSTCDNLPEPQAYSCYVLDFSSNDNKNASPNLEGEDTNITYLEIAGVKYNGPISLNHISVPGDCDAGDIMKTLLTNWFSSVPPQTIFNLDRVDVDCTGERASISVFFKSVDSIANSIKLKITGPGFPNGLFVLPANAGDGSCS